MADDDDDNHDGDDDMTDDDATEYLLVRWHCYPLPEGGLLVSYLTSSPLLGRWFHICISTLQPAARRRAFGFGKLRRASGDLRQVSGGLMQ